MPVSPEDRREKNYIFRRSLMDYGMGFIILCFGVFFAIADHFNIEFTIEPMFRYCLSGLFIIYGAWRMYRGYQKKYYSGE